MDDTSMASPSHRRTLYTTTPTTETDSSSRCNTLRCHDDFHATTLLLRLASLVTLNIVTIQDALTTT